MAMTVEYLKESIFKVDVDKAVDLACFLGETLFRNNLLFPDVNDIEKYLIESIYNNENNIFKADKSKPENHNKSLFVITEAYASGGHTRLMENLSLMLDSDKNVLVTRKSDQVAVKRLDVFFNHTELCIRNNKEQSTDYIYRIVNKIIKYDNIFLNISSEDIFTVIACGIVKKINKEVKIFFINHTDHAFTYGTSIADIWFGISVYGIGIDKLRGVQGRHSFLGIVINKPDADFFKPVKYPELSQASKFITAASAHKFRPYKKESIIELLSSILKVDNKKEVNVIGARLTINPWWWASKILYYKQLKFYKSLAYDDYLKLTGSADYYIDSHPAPGGTAFVEQFLQGIPCIGLKSQVGGYTPLEEIKQDNVEQVMSMLDSPPQASYIKSIQNKIFEVHAFSQVKKRFNDCVNNNALFANPMQSYLPQKEPIFLSNKSIVLSVGFIGFLFREDKALLIRCLRYAGVIKNVDNLVKRAVFKAYLSISK